MNHAEKTIKDLENRYGLGIQFRHDISILINTSSVVFSSGIPFEIKNLAPREIEFIQMLQVGVTFESLKAFLAQPRIDSMVNQFFKRNLLKSYFQDTGKEESHLNRQLHWLSHYHRDAHLAQLTFSRKKVLILGCGGTGGIIAQHLARSGLLNFVLIDGGKVDAPDLNRQMSYYPKHIGQFKVDVLSTELASIDFNIQCATHAEFIHSSDQLQQIVEQTKPDLIVNCADQPSIDIQLWAVQSAIRFQVPILFGNVGLEDAFLGPFLTTVEAMTKYENRVRRLKEKLGSRVTVLKSSLCFTNSLASTMLAFEAFKFLSQTTHNSLIDKMMSWDFQNVPMKLKLDYSNWSANETA